MHSSFHGNSYLCLLKETNQILESIPCLQDHIPETLTLIGTCLYGAKMSGMAGKCT